MRVADRLGVAVGVAVLMLALAACASRAEWSKEGASEQIVQRDSQDCSRSARVRAQREAFAGARPLAPPPSITVDPVTGQVRQGFRSQRSTVNLDEAALRLSFYRKCMRDLGYTLADES